VGDELLGCVGGLVLGAEQCNLWCGGGVCQRRDPESEREPTARERKREGEPRPPYNHNRNHTPDAWARERKREWGRPSTSHHPHHTHTPAS
jgi:hypothetical protein